MITEQERRVFTALRTNFEHYAEKCLVIRTKDGAVRPFILNKAQQYIHSKLEEQLRKKGKVRALILKGRQQGCSTYVGARYYWKTSQTKGYKTFILAHMADATDNLFKMVKRYHEHCPDLVKPSTSTTNRKELVFNKLDSGYALGTAGSPDVGRSDTIQLFHGSEAAFWSGTDGIVTGVMQTIPDTERTEIVLESTANGIGGLFHSLWMKAVAGENEYMPIFVPWFWQSEYSREVEEGFTPNKEEQELIDLYDLTHEQINWRRNKISSFTIDGSDGLWKFKQEYPNTPSEAFQSSGEQGLISNDCITRARKFIVPHQYQANVVGVDPARFGDDRTAIAWRNARHNRKIEYHSKKDTMQVAGICVNILQSEKIDKMFIDVGGLGAGVVDRLLELGFGNVVIPVNFGEAATKSDRYSNKRAEMWGEMSKWLTEGQCQIVDSNELHADLSAPLYDHDSNGRLRLESKKDMRKRVKISPDGGDALALTFAFPVIKGDVNTTIMSDINWNPLE